MPTSTSGPTPSRLQVVRQLVGARVQLAVGQLLRPRTRTATASGRARRLRLEQLVEAASLGDTRRAVSFHSTSSWCRSAAVEQRQLARAAAPGSRHHRLRADARSAAPGARSSPRRTGRCCTRSRRRSPSPSPRSDSVEVELGAVALVDVHAARRLQARRARSASPRSVLQREHHLEQRVCGSGRASRLQLLDQLLERQVLVRVGVQRASRAPAPAARGSAGRRERSARSTRVLTKKPISPSISARLRPAIGVPTAMSSWPL